MLRPALASDSGPDVFTLAASGSVGPADVFAPYATDLTPEVEELLGADWKSKVYPARADAFHEGRQADRNGVGEGRRGQHVDQPGDVRSVRGETADHVRDESVTACETFRANGLGCFKEGIGGSGFDVNTFHSIVNSIAPGAFREGDQG